jgi:hypothetical protein
MRSAKPPAQTPTYFATITDPVQYVAECLQKISEWREYCSSRGLVDLWSRKLSNYYGMSEDSYSSQRVLSGGSEGELSNIKVNDLHSLVQNQLVVVTAMRPAGVAKAINSDVRSLRNSRIGTAIAEYYLSQAGFEQQFVTACEIGLLIDEAFVDLFWDKDAGDAVRTAVDPQTGQSLNNQQPIMSGDLKMRIHTPYNVARDPAIQVSNQKWHIISLLFNRFDLAATHSKFSDVILGAAQDNVPQLKLQERQGDDNVYAHLVVHDRTPSVPNGRYSLIVGDALVADMPLPYPEYPVDRLSPEEVIDGPTGYCPSNDVMAMEEITDALHSIATTNNLTFGGQSIVGPPLTGIVVSEIAKSLRYFEIAPELVDKIKPLQLTKTAPETYNYIGMLSSKKQAALGSVTGTLQQQATQGASGAAMALIQAQAVQFNSGTQRSYFRLLSRVMTKAIGVLRVYADTPRVARIVGKSKSQGLKEFKYTGSDLNSISSIVYEMVNPVSQTIGGRMQLAEQLIQNSMITNPRQYLTVVETGSLDALTTPDEDMDLLILEENEALTDGTPVQAIIIENHANHIKGHMSTISTNEAKSDQQLISNVMGHIQQHLDLWQQASQSNPSILLATGQQPLPAPPPPPGIPGGPPPGGPPPGPPGPGHPPGPPGPPHGPPPPTGPQLPPGPNGALEAQQPNQPKMPINPATHERAVVPGAPA